MVWSKEIDFQNTCDLTHLPEYEANNTSVGLFGAMWLRGSKTFAKENLVFPTSSKHSVDSQS